MKTNKLCFSCFTIACKLESRRVPDANSLLSLFDARHHVTPMMLNQGEKQLLAQLNFELGLSKENQFFFISFFFIRFFKKNIHWQFIFCAIIFVFYHFILWFIHCQNT